MKKLILFPLLILLFYSCQKITKEEVLENISGYWEIEKVVLNDGSVKEYKVSTTIDLIKIEEGQKGLRKKLQPDLTGNFYGSDDIEQFEIIETPEGFWLEYKTRLMKWKEKIVDINHEKLVLQNENGIIYHYKPYKPIETIE